MNFSPSVLVSETFVLETCSRSLWHWWAGVHKRNSLLWPFSPETYERYTSKGGRRRAVTDERCCFLWKPLSLLLVKDSCQDAPSLLPPTKTFSSLKHSPGWQQKEAWLTGVGVVFVSRRWPLNSDLKWGFSDGSWGETADRCQSTFLCLRWPLEGQASGLEAVSG